MLKWIMFFSLLSCHAFANVPEWNVIPDKSSLTFTATQNNAPVKGVFKKFAAQINFDPDHLDQNTVKVTIDVKSIDNPYSDVVNTLQSAEWFNPSVYPQALFTASEFTKTGDKRYTAKGMLTIKNKTLPVTLDFTQEELTATHAVVKGGTVLKRTAFGIGEGEWASTKEIKDEVLIEFVISAVKK